MSSSSVRLSWSAAARAFLFIFLVTFPARSPAQAQSTVVPFAGLNAPFGVAVDAHYIYAADTQNHRVVKVPVDGSSQMLVFTGTSPRGVAAKGDTAYIVDAGNNQVVKVAPDGTQTPVPAIGVSSPYGVAVDAHYIYIADAGNNRVVKVAPDGTQTTVPAIGLNVPSGVAVDAIGTVYIADGKNNRVVKVAPDGTQTTVPAIGLNNAGGGVAVDAIGTVYIADVNNDRVVKVAPDGTQTTLSKSLLSQPYGVAVDATGNVYVANTNNNLVVKISAPQLPDITPPAPPTNLTATAGNQQVSLSWTANTEPDLAYYVLYRSLTNNFTPTATDSIARITKPTTTYTNTGLTNGTPYYYRLAATDSTGNRSSPSAQVSVTPTDMTPPAVPTNLSATAGDRQVSLIWTANTEPDLAYYVLYRSLTNNFTPTATDSIARITKPTTTFTNTGLTNGTTYYYRLAAVDSSGNKSNPTTQVSVTPTDMTPPAVPTNLSATAGNQQVSLSWTANTEPDLAYYVLYRSLTNNFTPTATDSIARITKPTTTYTNTGLMNGITYYYRLTAVDNAENESTPSTQVSATPTEGDTPVITVSPTALHFGNVAINHPSSLTLTISNPGTDTLTVSNLTILPDFTILPDPEHESDAGQFTVSATSLNVSAGDSRTVTVTFTPTALGTKSATLRLMHNAAGGQTDVDLDGTGIETPNLLRFSNAFAAPGGHAIVEVTLNTNQAVAGVQFKIQSVLNGNPTDKAQFIGVVNLFENLGFIATSEHNPYDPAGVITVILLSFSGEQFTPGEHTLLHLVYDIDEQTPHGTTIDLAVSDNILSSPPPLQEIPHTLDVGQIHIGQPGDGDGNGRFNILDVLNVIYIIVGRLPMPDFHSFDFFLVDVNGDGKINILDAVGIISQILSSPTKLVVDGPANPVTVSLGEVQSLASGQLAIPVTMQADGVVAGVQAEFTFDPTQLQLGTPQLAGRAEGMTVVSQVNDGTLHVVVYSATGQGIAAGSGTTLLIPVTVRSGSDATATLTLSQVILANRQAQEVSVTLGTNTVKVSALPTAFALKANRPNPFNPSTQIAYEVPQPTHVTLGVYNILGQEVVRLVDEQKTPGRYVVTWNGRNGKGLGVASGVYLYRLTTSTGFTQNHRMTLLK